MRYDISAFIIQLSWTVENPQVNGISTLIDSIEISYNI